VCSLNFLSSNTIGLEITARAVLSTVSYNYFGLDDLFGLMSNSGWLNNLQKHHFVEDEVKIGVHQRLVIVEGNLCQHPGRSLTALNEIYIVSCIL